MKGPTRKRLTCSTPRSIDRILTHEKVPREPVAADELPAKYYDVTGESVPSWVLGVDPDPDERGPPAYDELIDPPAPEM